MAIGESSTIEKLRKLASALRERHAAEQSLRFKQAGHVLRAAKGLTLLRDKVRA